MNKGRKHIIDLLKNECSDDAKSITNQMQLYSEAMNISQKQLEQIISESSAQTVEQELEAISNFDSQQTAVNKILLDVKKILEFDID